MSTQAFLGCIPLIERLLFNPSSLPGCCAHEMSVQTTGDVPNGGGALIVLAKPVVLEASHRPICDAADKIWIDCHCAPATYNFAKGELRLSPDQYAWLRRELAQKPLILQSKLSIFYPQFMERPA
jgi:hypothetical protein